MKVSDLVDLEEIIKTNPLWYQDYRIESFINLFHQKHLTEDQRSQKYKFKKLLSASDFLVGETGYNWDQWRLPIDRAVIHHTSSTPTISLRELNVLGLRLYIEQYIKDPDVKDQPLYSGHYWHGKEHVKENMCFVSYHYLVRPNGKIIQLVDDSAYLWHAGNLDFNRKSISIALAGKFIDKEPTKEAIRSVGKILKNHNITREKVYGHCESTETMCPGNTFIDVWKRKIIENL